MWLVLSRSGDGLMLMVVMAVGGCGRLRLGSAFIVIHVLPCVRSSSRSRKHVSTNGITLMAAAGMCVFYCFWRTCTQAIIWFNKRAYWWFSVVNSGFSVMLLVSGGVPQGSFFQSMKHSRDHVVYDVICWSTTSSWDIKVVIGKEEQFSCISLFRLLFIRGTWIVP